MEGPPGPRGSSRKRKAESELSQNVHTRRARRRKDMLSQHENSNKIEKAKAADQGAITYARSKLRKTPAFISASQQDQENMLGQTAKDVILKRRKKGCDWKTVAEKIGLAEADSLHVVDDDGDTDWEDIEYHPDHAAEFEELWKQDEVQNMDSSNLVVSAEDLHEQGGGLMGDKSRMKTQQLEFKIWRTTWRRTRKSLFDKVEKLSAGGMEFLLRTQNPYLTKSGVFMHIPTPEKFFTKGERAVWRNLATWSIDGDWVDLPGPVEWWPEEGLGARREKLWFSDRSAQGHRNAIDMLERGWEFDEEMYERVLPGDCDLWVMDDTSYTRKVLKSFFTM